MTTPRREIGFPTAVSLVVGSMIGSGVFLLPASLAPYGGLSLAGWMVSASGAVLLALVFAHLARRRPAAGGLYAYTRDAFGELAGFLVAWGYWTSIWCANAALAVAFVGYLDPFLPAIVRAKPAAALVAVGAVWLLTFVNSLGLRTAGRLQVATTVLKLTPLVLIAAAGLIAFDPSRFALPDQPVAMHARALLAVVTMTLFAFLGLEVATVPAAAVSDPDRTIPRATIVGTVLTAAIYVAATAGVMSLVAPGALAASTAPFADAARALAGDALARVVAAGAAVSAFGALNGWILVGGQLALAVSRDGVFPATFRRVNARGIPVPAMLAAGVLSSALIGLNYSNSENLVELFTSMMLLSTLSTLVPYTFCSLAVFLPGGRRAADLGRSMRLIAAAAFVYALFAIGGAGQDVVYLGFLLLVGGLPVFVWVRRSVAPAAKE